MTDKDTSKQPGGFAGGKASAERPEEERRASSQKAAETRHKNMVGENITPTEPNQPQDFSQEIRSSQWAVEREGNPDIKEQERLGDKQAAAMMETRDRQDQEYNPDNPREEQIERQ